MVEELGDMVGGGTGKRGGCDYQWIRATWAILVMKPLRILTMVINKQTYTYDKTKQNYNTQTIRNEYR